MKAKVHLEDHGSVLASFDGQPSGYKVERNGAVVEITISYLATETQEADMKRRQWNPGAARG